MHGWSKDWKVYSTNEYCDMLNPSTFITAKVKLADVISTATENDHAKGKLVVAPSSISLAPINKVIPLWNGTSGYEFAAVSLASQRFTPVGGTGFQVVFKPSFGMRDETSLVKTCFTDGCTDNNLKIRLVLSQVEKDGTNGKQLFTFSDELVKTVYTTRNATFTLSVSSTGNIMEVSIHSVVASDSVVSTASQSMDFAVK